MTNRSMGAALALAGLAFGAGERLHAQSVEFRIVERQGQQAIVTPVGTTPTTDAVLNFAVQGRVVGGGPAMGLGNFSFDIVIDGELDANGVLSKLLTSNPDGTYALNTNQSVNPTTGWGGLARPYSYLAGVSPDFNGLINTTHGSVTNGPSQEIFLITGSPTGQALLDVTDLDSDGNPDTYGGPLPAPQGARTAVNANIGAEYFGVGGRWVDVYRFKYTVTNTTTARVLHVSLSFRSAQLFSELILSNGVWGPVQANASSTLVALDVPIGGTMACCDTATGACAVVDGTQCANGTFAASGSCTPSPCPVVGACCVSGGACTIGVPSACAGIWTIGGTCGPNACQQMGACCDTGTGACSVVAVGACFGPSIAGSTCQPNMCEQPGPCCLESGACQLVLARRCVGGGVVATCQPNPCSQPVACCSTNGQCQLSQPSSCLGVVAGRACQPNPCPQPGACCSTGTCTLVLQSACSGVWTASTACTTNLCILGRCCTVLGNCTLVIRSQCATMWTVGGTCGAGACPVLGACCQRSACTLMERATCAAVVGQYRGDGVACLPAGAFNACCPGNFDGENGIAVVDIFAFLAAWFAGDPRADIDHTNGIVISDIYTFLGDWFAGC